jgi:hypothetical protein
MTRPTDPGEDKVEALRVECEELRKERDALLQKPIDLAKMDSIDEDASGKMVAYYWWQQAQNAHAIAAMGHTPPSGKDG